MKHLREMLAFCFGTWRRALIALGVIAVLAVSGVLKWFVSATLNNVVLPLFYAALVIGILWMIIRWLLFGKPRKPGG